MAITAVISPEDLSWDDFDVTPDRILDPADGTMVDAFTRFDFDFPDLAPRKIGNEFALADPNVITISPNAQVFANVLQTGGETGMWNFDRYQRWVAQKKDWVQPTLATPLPEERVAPAPLKIQRQTITPTVVKDDSMEISIDEEVDLDELAKRIEQRTRGPRE